MTSESDHAQKSKFPQTQVCRFLEWINLDAILLFEMKYHNTGEHQSTVTCAYYRNYKYIRQSHFAKGEQQTHQLHEW